MLAQPNGSGLGEGSQPCLHPGKEPMPPFCWPPHTRDRESKVGTCAEDDYLVVSNCTARKKGRETTWSLGGSWNLSCLQQLVKKAGGKITFPNCPQAHHLVLKTSLMTVDILCHVSPTGRAFLFGKRRERGERKRDDSRVLNF